MKKVAFLATGDEIVNGDILNTNSRAMAQQLFDSEITTDMHLSVSDTETDISEAINYLLTKHDALIITGGLGPTSDDRTRFALSKALDLDLVFDDQNWQDIQARFKKFNLINQPESNKQQALFPKTASIINNLNGSAGGCHLSHHNKLIFMLPGPPDECMPMFKQAVLPLLKQANFSEHIIFKKWLLFGVSEGEIAEQLDRLAKPFNINTGYRVNYPYVEFKARTKHEKDMRDFINVAKVLIQKHLINTESLPASVLLSKLLSAAQAPIYIIDQATKGYFEKAIKTIDNHDRLFFIDKTNQQSPLIIISGLEEVWQPMESQRETRLSLKLQNKKQSFTLPYRGKRTLSLAIEILSRELLKHF